MTDKWTDNKLNCQHGKLIGSCSRCDEINRRIDQDNKIYHTDWRRKPGARIIPARAKETPRAEAIRILGIIRQHKPDEFFNCDEDFIRSITRQLENDDRYEPSRKQIFWMRDIKDKLL